MILSGCDGGGQDVSVGGTAAGSLCGRAAAWSRWGRHDTERSVSAQHHGSAAHCQDRTFSLLFSVTRTLTLVAGLARSGGDGRG
jgi:hypothetical protein